MGRIATLFLISSLLVACTTVMPATLPATTSSPVGNLLPSPPPLHTLTTLPGSALTPTPIPSITPLPTSAFSLRRVAQIGGSIKGIAVVGNVAYIGIGPRLAAIDISRHDNPELISQSEPLPGSVTKIIQIASQPAPLLLVNAGKYLVIVDISSPTELKPIHQVEMPGAISALAWDSQAGVAYAGGSIYQKPDRYTGFIAAALVTPDRHLKLTDSVSMPEWPNCLAPGNGSLFAGAGGYEGGLYFIEVNPSGKLSAPSLVIASTPEKPLQPLSMQVIGERLYLGYRGFEVYDIAGPGQPVPVWSKNIPGGPVIYSFIISGKQVYIFGYTILSEFMQGAFTVPEPIEGAPIGVTSTVTAIHNGDFLVAYKDLKIYDTADPQNFRLVGSFQPPVTDAIAAVVNEQVVFVVDNGSGDGLSQAVLQVLSLPDLTFIGKVVTEISNREGSIHDIALDGDRVYIASEDRVWVYDVSEANPTLAGKLEPGNGEIGEIAALTLDGVRLLVLSQETKESTHLTSYDMTILQQPALEKISTVYPGETIQLGWDEYGFNLLMRPLYENKYVMLYRYDKRLILSMEEFLNVPGYFVSMAAGQEFIALAGSNSLSIVTEDKTGKRNIQAQAALPEYGLGVAVLEDRVLVVVGDEYGAAQLLMFDLHDPAVPRQAEALDIAVSSLYQVPVLVTGPYVILANGAGGVEVLK